MKNSQQVWDLWTTSRAYQVRPSELLCLTDQFAAFCLDRAVHDFGSAVESALSRVEGKGQKEIDVKSERLLRKWLDMPAQYRDPSSSGHIALPKKGED